MQRVYYHFGGCAVTIKIISGWVRRSDRDGLVMRHISGARE
ncbi:hypothetical protein Godav_023318 [Gossypium davidsonii]|uniref:Uncharacterized protein n=1 Tax=Gossypium davidsonii TaxID=34287 RepID=A0A7J8SR90_GOSDV|nr:hypothetical protein [Gossypium davidsonii]